MDENIIISFVIERTQRVRYREHLTNPKKRGRVLDKLNHSPPLDERWTTWYSSLKKAINSIQVSPDKEVYVLSAAKEIDGKIMPFMEAVEKIQYFGWGSIIGISPVLALYYGEEGEKNAVIQKKA